MKKLILLFTCFYFSLFSYSIVFVHIGKEIPSYLKESVEQARLFNPHADIYVIGGHKMIKKFFRKYDKTNLHLVYLENLSKLPTHQNFLQKFSLHKIYNQKLWKVSLERFFYLSSFLKEKNLQDVFHLENDVMLYSDLSTYLKTFHEKYPFLGGTLDNDERCIAGFIYIPNQECISSLTDYIANHAQENLCDMEFLAKFYKETKRLVPLPVIPASYCLDYPLKSLINLTTKNPEIFSQNIELFDSIFDAAALGQYLGGKDPRYHKKLEIGFVNERALFNPSFFTYVWKKDELGRKVPYIQFKDKTYRINNLHIHSKRLKDFRS